MKLLILLTVVAFLQLSCALMSVDEFEVNNLAKCYDPNEQDSRKISDRNINGQVLPLPNSVETFISIVERYESLNPNVQVKELVEKLLRNFRTDDLRPVPVHDDAILRDDAASNHNQLKRLIFSVPNTVLQYSFNEEDFTRDEKCALHFMLSHTVNDSRANENDDLLPDQKDKIKEPRELGVVSLNSKRKHAFALGRVLLGIYAAYLPSSSEEITTILRREKNIDKPELTNVRINPVHAVTIADLIMRVAEETDMRILPNGVWNDISCPTEYRLEDNNLGFVTYSELRGAVDGLLIGRVIQENRQEYSVFRLSQLLRMYYGISGLPDSQRTKWCYRENNIQNTQIVGDMANEVINYIKLYRAMNSGGTVKQNTQDRVRNTLSVLRDSSFSDVEKDECSVSELSADRKYTSPRNIFAILDYSTSGSTKLDIQTEIIGNLSTDFDLRPRGNLMGVYTNLRPLLQNTLDVVVKNSGTAGCPSCFAKYYKRPGNKQDDAELFRDLNSTLRSFEEEQEQLEEKYHSEVKAGSPGKIVLYFNFGSINNDYQLRDALWELRRSFGGTTILAIGDNRDNLKAIVENDQTDIFTVSSRVFQELKQRINKVPAEFTFKECYQSSPSKESDNKQEGYIALNKIQYWAMYPQYFLKSYGIKLRFRSQESTQIRVCFSRSYSAIIEGKSTNCKDSSGSDIEFYENNPCKKKNVFNCEPFFFSVEGKKQSNSYCESLRCGSQNDIQFIFEHEGISCNFANYVNISSLALLFAAFMYYFQSQ